MTGIKDSFLSSRMFVCSLRMVSLSSYKTILTGSPNRAFFESKCYLLAVSFSKSGPPSLIPPKSPVVEATFPKTETYFGGSIELPKSERVEFSPKRPPDLGADNGLALLPNKLFCLSELFI